MKASTKGQSPPLTSAQRVLHALVWNFLSYKDGLCFPSYETIADKAKCCRDTVYKAIKGLPIIMAGANDDAVALCHSNTHALAT